MSTPINVIIDNKTIIDDVVSLDIEQVELNYCNSVSLELKSQTWWGRCNPTIDFGQLRIKVVIGSITYQFLCEERDTSVDSKGVTYTVWGRSKQALLSAPYSTTVTDDETTVSTHPWQTGNTTASQLIAYVVSNFCSYGVTVNWNVTDYIIYKDSISFSNQSPIDIITSLAAVVGAKLQANEDGSLSVEEYTALEGTAIAEYTGLDNIVALSESIDYPSGYNSVTVYGYDATVSSGSSTISVEEVDLDVDTTTKDFMGAGQSVGQGQAKDIRARGVLPLVYSGQEHLVNVFFYHSNPLTYPLCYIPPGKGEFEVKTAIGISGSELIKPEKTIIEEILLVWGHGNRSKPNTAGETEVHESGLAKGVSGDIPFGKVVDTYNTNYLQFALRAPIGATGEQQAMFYFDDKSSYQIYSYQVENPDDLGDDPDDDSSTDTCSSILMDKESPATVTPNDEVKIKIYGETPNTVKLSSGATATFVKSNVEEWSEEIVFQNGEAELIYPVDYRSVPEVSFSTEGVGEPPITYKNKSNKLIVNKFIDDPNFFTIPASVTYQTAYKSYKARVPRGWVSTTIDCIATFAGCSTQTLSISVSGTTGGAGTRDLIFIVKDYSTGVVIANASVWTGKVGSGLGFRGRTDANGSIIIPGRRTGDHNIKITASGYLDSDQDDINNDTITVTLPG